MMIWRPTRLSSPPSPTSPSLETSLPKSPAPRTSPQSSPPSSSSPRLPSSPPWRLPSLLLLPPSPRARTLLLLRSPSRLLPRTLPSRSSGFTATPVPAVITRSTRPRPPLCTLPPLWQLSTPLRTRRTKGPSPPNSSSLMRSLTSPPSLSHHRNPSPPVELPPAPCTFSTRPLRPRPPCSRAFSPLRPPSHTSPSLRTTSCSPWSGPTLTILLSLSRPPPTRSSSRPRPASPRSSELRFLLPTWTLSPSSPPEPTA
mmetsp:Transcript_10628/g.19247  ORF Transcript_10628/g.19247 Transcript_10628/m.19247 type:complete len:256 (-) Transcript_10628:5846-6613(-)